MYNYQIRTLDDFRRACEAHDLTYMMSDDGEAYRRGAQSLGQIQAASKEFPRADVVRIWNEVVDSKLIPDARETFYWRINQ